MFYHFLCVVTQDEFNYYFSIYGEQNFEFTLLAKEKLPVSDWDGYTNATNEAQNFISAEINGQIARFPKWDISLMKYKIIHP